MTDQDTNYAGKNNVLPVLRPYIMSGGTLQPIGVTVAASGFSITNFSTLDWDIVTGGVGPSYQQAIDALGLQQGDQLTFLFAYVDDTGDDASMIDFRYARLILDPSDGVLTKPIFTPSSQGGTDYIINAANANARNEGEIHINATGLVAGNKSADEYTAGSSRCLAGFAVIASRLNGGVWQRSRAQLVIRPNTGTGATTNDHETATLGDAIYSFLTSASSSLYLNQAQDF